MQTLICNMQITHVFAKHNAVNAHKRLFETIDVDKRNRKCMHAATFKKAIAEALGQHNKMRQTLARRRCEFKFVRCTYYTFVFAKNKLRQFDVMKQQTCPSVPISLSRTRTHTSCERCR